MQYLLGTPRHKAVEVTIYVADKSGSTLLSCATSLKLDLIKLWPRLGVPPLRAKIITSQADRASPTTNWVTKGKIMFNEMSRCASTTPMTHSTTSDSGQLRKATVPLWLVIQTSGICCFDQQNEIYPSGYINQPLSAHLIIQISDIYQNYHVNKMNKMIPGSSMCGQNSQSYGQFCDNWPADILAAWYAIISCPTCTIKEAGISHPMDLEEHGMHQNAQNDIPDKMVPLKSMLDQNQAKTCHYQLPNIGCPIYQPPEMCSIPK